jgi:hypothetical protein
VPHRTQDQTGSVSVVWENRTMARHPGMSVLCHNAPPPVHCPGSASLNLACLCTRPYKGCNVTWPSQPISFSDFLYTRSVNINLLHVNTCSFIYTLICFFPYIYVCPLNTVFLRITELLLFHCKFTITLHCSVAS